MPATLSKEAELKKQVAELKTTVSGLDQKAVVLSKELGHARGELEKLAALKADRDALAKQAANLEALNSALRAEVTSLQAHAAAADSVLGVAKALKALLAKV